MNIKLILRIIVVKMKMYIGRWNTSVAGGLYAIIIMETVLFLSDRNVPNRKRDRNNNNKTINWGCVLAIHFATRPEHGVAFVLSTTTIATLLLKEKHVYRKRAKTHRYLKKNNNKLACAVSWHKHDHIKNSKKSDRPDFLIM